jgi:hypothetical protein
MGSILRTVSFFLFLVGHCQSQQFLNPNLIISAESERTFEQWGIAINEQLEQQQSGDSYDFMSLLRQVFTALKSSSFPTAVANNISQQCLEDSQFYVNSLYTNQSRWAIQSKLFFK